MRSNLLVVTLAIGTLAGPGVASATMFGIGFDRTLYLIDEADGSGSAIGSVAGSAAVNAAATDSRGVSYIATIANDQLVEIQSDGSSTLGAMLDRSVGARGLAFSPGDVLFAIEGGVAFDPDTLVTIDVDTGAVTTVGSFGIDQVQALAFSTSGTLYAWDGNAGLLTVDPATGLATDVNPNVGGTFAIQAIEFGSNGILYGGQDELFEISVADGSTTLIGSGSYTNVRGLALVPEPGAGPLGLASLLTLVVCGGDLGWG